MIFKIVQTELRCGKRIIDLLYLFALAVGFTKIYYFNDVVSLKKEFIFFSFFILFLYHMVSMTLSLARRTTRQYTQLPIKSSQIMIANWIGVYISVILHILITIIILSFFDMKLEFSDVVNTVGVGLCYLIIMIVTIVNWFVFSWKNGYRRFECYCLFLFPICGLIFLHIEIKSHYGDAYLFWEKYPIGLILPLTIICLLLTAANIWLFNRKDDYLDEEYMLPARK